MGNKYFKNQSYKVINTQPYDHFCVDIAINDKNNLLALGSKFNVNIQQFKNGKTKKLQDLMKHCSIVLILKFFKKKPLLISGSRDGTIIIWACNLMSNPKYTHQLNGHSNDIKFIIVHPQQEDLIISASDDKTIKFWSLQQSSWSCVQTMEEHNDFIFQISLSPDGNKLISCSCDNQIIIMKGSHKSQWLVVQKIQLNNYGYRLCFINNYMFAFQALKGTHLLIYKQNPSEDLFHNLYKIPVKGGNQPCWHQFPLQYITSNNNLIVKNGQYLNIIELTQIQDINNQDVKNMQNLQYKLQQQIKFENNIIFGTVSENGEYIIIYDKITKIIEIRQRTQQE